ncbi:MAG TPA: adenylate kinase [Bacillota bacterium]|nr:adenylate kinase [Bacillota bacterium]HOR86046.1 adenylate kinase [Bacillota bacterium]HPL53538.1 adenylate kinase [Bacillota bacterium]
MRIVLLGSPGSGKGTQAIRIKKKFGIPHISTGDIFRDNIERNTTIGMEAKSYISKGLLVPDSVTIQIVENRLAEDDCKDGFLLDGFPRNLPQAEVLDKGLEKTGKKLDAVVNLDVTDEIIIKRMANRRICSSCGESYNLLFSKPAADGICDKCGGKLYIREDDKPETVVNRLSVYRNQTFPLVEYYNKKGILITVNGEDSADKTFLDILSSLERLP